MTCVEWQRYVDPQGYGRLTVDGRHGTLAHRHVWEKANGPIPPGLQVHHTCENRRCVNLEHLALVTQKVNILVGSGPTAQNARKTHCDHGHPFDEANTYMRNGERQCRACNAQRVHEYRRRKSEVPA